METAIKSIIDRDKFHDLHNTYALIKFGIRGGQAVFILYYSYVLFHWLRVQGNF